jgi:molybdenum cofactor synthesis domain-containing protein
VRVGILTVSTKGARGERADTSGAAIRELLAPLGATVVHYQIVPDDRATIARLLRAWADDGQVDLILTTGGTGLAPTDVTPEATREVIEREVPGLAEVMRLATWSQSPRAVLSRAVAGTRGRTLIVNLPGSPRGVRECLGVILPVLPHAVDILQGRGDHA